LFAGLREALEVEVGRGADLLAAIAERRQFERDDVQAVEEVLAEAAVLDHLRQDGVGGGDHADADALRLRVAQSVDLARLEEAEELGLGLERQVAVLVPGRGCRARPSG